MRCALLISILFQTGCSTIQSYDSLSQNVGIELSTYIGGKVIRVERTSDLPNAFGAADLFGGKVNRGFTELRYQGLASDGRLVFRVTEVETQSTETTMSRYGSTTSTLNTYQIGNSSFGTITTDYPRSGSTEALPPNTAEFKIDQNKIKEFTIAKIRVHIINATETFLTYTLNK